MYGIIIAFQNFKLTKGILGSSWVGFKYFEAFFNSRSCASIISNTLIISLEGILIGFPFPILLALMLNEIGCARYKKALQMITYAPYFISTVVIVSMIQQLFAMQTGLVNMLISALGMEQINFMGTESYFRPLYIGSGIWQSTGFNAVLYIAALSAVDVSLYEAAKIDGANRLQRMWYIDLPSILPTATILLILSFGQIMNVGYEKIYLMQNNTNLDVSEILSTYVYKLGLINLNFSQSTAIGLFNSVVNLVMLVICNTLAGKLSETSLW